MAALVKQIDSITRYAEFSIDDASEVDLLPTTTSRGRTGSPLASVNPVCAGSCAYDTKTLDVYLLSNDDVWNLA